MIKNKKGHGTHLPLALGWNLLYMPASSAKHSYTRSFFLSAPSLFFAFAAAYRKKLSHIRSVCDWACTPRTYKAHEILPYAMSHYLCHSFCWSLQCKWWMTLHFDCKSILLRLLNLSNRLASIHEVCCRTDYYLNAENGTQVCLNVSLKATHELPKQH